MRMKQILMLCALGWVPIAASAQTAQAPTYQKGNQITAADGIFVIDKSGNPFGTNINPLNTFDANTATIAGAITAPLNAQTTHGVLVGAVEGATAAGTSSAYPLTIQGNASGVAVPVSGTITASLGTANGWTPFLANGLTTTVRTVKSSAGELGTVQCYNPNGSQVYVQVFNTTSVTLGTTTPALSIAIAPSSTGGLALANPGITFSAAIAIAATTTATGSTAPSTAPDCNVAYN